MKNGQTIKTRKRILYDKMDSTFDNKQKPRKENINLMGHH